MSEKPWLTISPAVMLSPNARNRVRLSLGGGSTVTMNVQASVRAWASITVQLTVVEPTLNAVPAPGVQVGPVKGVTPPATIGVPYPTNADRPSGDWTGSGGLGQEILGAPGSTVGGVALVGLAQAESRHAPANAVMRQRRVRCI